MEQNTHRADDIGELGMFRFDSRDEHENRAGISIKGDFYIVACNAAVDYALPTFWKENTYDTVWRGGIDMLVQPSSAFIGSTFNTCLYLTSKVVTRASTATGYAQP